MLHSIERFAAAELDSVAEMSMVAELQCQQWLPFLDDLYFLYKGVSKRTQNLAYLLVPQTATMAALTYLCPPVLVHFNF